ncbi:MAG: phosphoribosyl-AMP cyclohydrolase [Thermoclostridium sp.]|nr:phosphoribosyl-AMP cyclohydrolase [Thermoclostridium sp.]
MELLKFNEQGLIPVIVQDAENREVLMMAWMNQQALDQTIATGRATYWSRSRSKLWVKGETSGHFQFVKEIRVDCDADTLLISVEQLGAACHTGSRTCFYRELSKKGECTIAEHI